MVVGLALFSMSAALRQGGLLPDTPANHWVYEGYSLARARRLLFGFPELTKDDYRHAIHPTRFSMSVAYHAMAGRLLGYVRGLHEQANQVELDQPGAPQALKDLARWKEELAYLREPETLKVLPYLERAGKEFAPELKALGASPNDIPAAITSFRYGIQTAQLPKIGAAYHLFSDVPQDHWASKLP